MPPRRPWPQRCQEHPRAGGAGTRREGPHADAQARIGLGGLWLRGFPAQHAGLLGSTHAPKKTLCGLVLHEPHSPAGAEPVGSPQPSATIPGADILLTA